MLCELCLMNKADSLVWIKDTYWTEHKRRTLKYLCEACRLELESEHINIQVLKVLEHNAETPDMARRPSYA